MTIDIIRQLADGLRNGGFQKADEVREILELIRPIPTSIEFTPTIKENLLKMLEIHLTVVEEFGLFRSILLEDDEFTGPVEEIPDDMTPRPDSALWAGFQRNVDDEFSDDLTDWLASSQDYQ